ncbi:caspase family protein [Candidatus Electronema sp. JC]|uniref:caspase family protein n=1 Tax=Candidatus Electronema sp. JC TaxID=3401570 RepID=UPI003B4366FD
MSKKALCVGINKYPVLDGKDISLRGCVNDAMAWADLLVNHYDFANVTLLLDDQATKTKMIEGLKNLLLGAQAGDVLVFTNSSHGTYVIDNDDDEIKTVWMGQYDQAICPYDCKDNLLIDDEIRELLYDLPADVQLTVISDSCHSATVTKAIIKAQPSSIVPPDDRRPRLLPPEWLGFRAINSARETPEITSIIKKSKYPESEMKEILLSGCKRMQSSFDAAIKGKYHGAMTYFAIESIKAAGYKLTYQELYDMYLNDFEDKYSYNQQPQLEGTDANKQRQLFT